MKPSAIVPSVATVAEPVPHVTVSAIVIVPDGKIDPAKLTLAAMVTLWPKPAVCGMGTRIYLGIGGRQ